MEKLQQVQIYFFQSVSIFLFCVPDFRPMISLINLKITQNKKNIFVSTFCLCRKLCIKTEYAKKKK